MTARALLHKCVGRPRGPRLLTGALLLLNLSLPCMQRPARAVTDYTIRGTITESGVDAPGVTVTLTGVGFTTTTATTGSDGSYSFTVPPGTYTATPSTSTANNAFIPASAPITVATGNAFQSFLVVTAYTISGTVTLNGSPAAGVSIQGGNSEPPTTPQSPLNTSNVRVPTSCEPSAPTPTSAPASLRARSTQQMSLK
jgi:hypothetical protein